MSETQIQVPNYKTYKCTIQFNKNKNPRDLVLLLQKLVTVQENNSKFCI